MNDQLIRDLLHEVADDIEPGDRLDAIRAATAPAGRRTHRAWWAAGGAGLLAASVVTALALTTGGAPQTNGSDPAGPASETAPAGEPAGGPVAVYFVGDTAEGSRLFREFQPTDEPDGGVLYAIDAALRGDALDPDYRSAWPAGVRLRQWIPKPDVITVILDDAPVERPAGMSKDDAGLALEQLVRTAQALYGNGKVPVDVQLEQQVTDTILGVATTEPLRGAPDADVLAPVSLSDPSEGLEVDNDEGRLTVRGRASGTDGTVTTRVQRWEGTFVVGQEVDRLAADGAGLVPFTATFDLSDAPAGDYVVMSQVQTPSGALTTDTRRFTVVE
ncbi:hypothetical protein J2X46_000055 [Nocardioides sp. BE266]|uniref:GerMN domain-containing protein n=1 Tax=Nocardioides sp. BE266 TaxID=2817725 RepID=UPI00285E323A|nr:GerMN domain-containing protein [Nocardioides sp. BE266]MDR7251083.1 hypothetical protein [Nocardioides sp. BE266]